MPVDTIGEFKLNVFDGVIKVSETKVDLKVKLSDKNNVLALIGNFTTSHSSDTYYKRMHICFLISDSFS